MPARSLCLFLALSCIAASRTGAAQAADATLFPLAEVRPGLEGHGRTVFHGERVEEFSVHLLGVLENAVGPRQSLVLARLEGGPLAQTGVIAGMSGSPVYVGGRLLGAVAYAFPFGREPIAGITPIGEMIEAAATGAPRAAATRFRSGAPDGLPAPLDRASVAAALQRPLRSVVPPLAFAAPEAPRPAAAAVLRPLALPLTFSGFETDTFDWARGVFASLGFAPAASGASGATIPGAQPLEPGSAVGISLIEGDLDLSATGTLTHLDGDRVYAFGHPFYGLGPIRFPLKKAWVHSVFPSLQLSWKMAAATTTVGVLDQDRATTVAGTLGTGPRLIPVEVRLRSARAGERVFRYRMVDDELLTPLLSYVSLLSILQGHERAIGAATLRVSARLALAGGSEVRVDDILASEQPGSQAAAVIASPLAALFANRFAAVGLERVDVVVEADEALRTATITRAWIDAPAPLRPGSSAPLRVQVRGHRGDVRTESLQIEVPPSARPGSYTLLVADGPTLDATEQREIRQRLAARDLPHLVRTLNRIRGSNAIHARLSRPEAGAAVGGEALPALPASVLAVLGAADQGVAVVPLTSAPVWSGKCPTDYAVSGSRQITVTVQR